MKWWQWSGWFRKSSTSNASHPQSSTSCGKTFLTIYIHVPLHIYTQKYTYNYHLHLRFYLKAARANPEIEMKAKSLAVTSLSDHTQLCFWPSTVAAALVVLACIEHNKISAYQRVIKVSVPSITLSYLLVSKNIQEYSRSQNFSISISRSMLEQQITSCLNASRYNKISLSSYTILIYSTKRKVSDCVQICVSYTTESGLVAWAVSNQKEQKS